MLVLSTNLRLKSNSIANFYDTTTNNGANGYGIGGNINYAAVTAIRIKTANYTTLSSPSHPLSTGFIQYTEYQKIGGVPETINGKVFVVGSVFVPQTSGITTAQIDNWETTGYYVYPFLATWLPTSSQTPLEISAVQFGQLGDDISDNEYAYAYEVYYDTQVANFTSVDGTTYMVLTGDADYGTDNFVAGEVFTAVDASQITVNGSVVVLYASTSGYAALVYTIIRDLNDLIEQQIGKNNQDLVEPIEGYILKIRTKLEALEYSSYTNNVSLLYAYQTIIDLQAKLSQLLYG